MFHLCGIKNCSSCNVYFGKVLFVFWGARRITEIGSLRWAIAI
jgi:hypothetical protein